MSATEHVPRVNTYHGARLKVVGPDLGSDCARTSRKNAKVNASAHLEQLITSTRNKSSSRSDNVILSL